MRAFMIPGVLLLGAAFVVGCDQGTPTSPSVDALGLQLDQRVELFECTFFTLETPPSSGQTLVRSVPERVAQKLVDSAVALCPPLTPTP